MGRVRQWGNAASEFLHLVAMVGCRQSGLRPTLLRSNFKFSTADEQCAKVGSSGTNEKVKALLRWSSMVREQHHDKKVTMEPMPE